MDELNSAPRDSESSSCKCWDKCWFVTISIVTWVIGVGALVAAGYCGINGKSAIDDYNNLKRRIEEKSKELEEVIIEIRNYTSWIEKIKGDISKEENILNLTKKEFEDALKNYTEREKEYKNYEEQLKKVQEEILSLNKSNIELRTKNVEIEEKIKTVTKEINNTRRNAEIYGKEATIFKISSAILGAGIIGFAIDIFIQANKLKELNNRTAEYDYYLKSFELVAEKEVHYELMKYLRGKGVKRESCYEGAGEKRITSCTGKHPTITTITTGDKYQFGATLFIGWPTEDGEYDDSKAYTFSAYVARETTHVENTKAMVLNKDVVLIFGESDIEIVSRGTGKVAEKSFSIPDPYRPGNFYVEGREFVVKSIKVDYLTDFE